MGGTTSVLPDGSVHGEGDSYEQTKFILEKQIKIIEQAGGKAEDIISVKHYITPDYDIEEGLKAYTEVFRRR